MGLVRAMYQRFQQLIHEFAKFGVIGVIGLLITNFGVGLLHFDMGVGPTTSTTAATVVAMAVTYVGNRYWSFRHRERTNIPRETVIFIVLNVIGLLIQDAATWVNYYGFGYHDKFSVFVALNFGIAVATVFRFWSYRKFVWAPSSPSGGGEAGDGAVPAGPAPAAPGMARVGSGAQAGYANGNGGAPNGAETNGAAAGPDGAAGANGHLVSGGATHSGQSLN